MNTLNPNATGRKAGAKAADGAPVRATGPPDELFPGVRLGSLIPRKRYSQALGLHPKTCARHEREDPQFPRPIYLNGRAYLPSEKLEEYRRILIERGYTRVGSFPANPRREG